MKSSLKAGLKETIKTALAFVVVGVVFVGIPILQDVLSEVWNG
jgi:hypothetical protein